MTYTLSVFWLFLRDVSFYGIAFLPDFSRSQVAGPAERHFKATSRITLMVLGKAWKLLTLNYGSRAWWESIRKVGMPQHWWGFAELFGKPQTAQKTITDYNLLNFIRSHGRDDTLLIYRERLNFKIWYEPCWWTKLLCHTVSLLATWCVEELCPPYKYALLPWRVVNMTALVNIVAWPKDRG